MDRGEEEKATVVKSELLLSYVRMSLLILKRSAVGFGSEKRVCL